VAVSPAAASVVATSSRKLPRRVVRVAAAAAMLFGLIALVFTSSLGDWSGGGFDAQAAEVVALDVANSTFSTSFGDLNVPAGPGDIAYRYITLTNGRDGDVAASLWVTSVVTGDTKAPVATNTQLADGTSTEFKQCSVPWNTTTGSCPGAMTASVAPAIVSTIATANRAVPMRFGGNDTLSRGESAYLRLEIVLAPNADPALQGGLFAWTFSINASSRSSGDDQRSGRSPAENS
jgi:hypothetical protein